MCIRDRYRQRYVDLVVNSEVKETFIKRSKIISSIRRFLEKLNFIEVETPILQPIPGGAAARPFVTHHNALDTPLYLRIANELYLKRLIVGGFDGVYEFAKDFRNEGMSRFHNPEFTQCEFYVAYKDYVWMMDFIEDMFKRIVKKVCGSTKVSCGENKIDFEKKWERYSMYEAIEKFTSVDVSEMDEISIRKVCKDMNVKVDKSMGRGKLIDEIFGEKCEPNLIQPTYITDYPIEMSPLAKKHRDKDGLVERFELICNGKEICNAFSEINDPGGSLQVFENQYYKFTTTSRNLFISDQVNSDSNLSEVFPSRQVSSKEYLLFIASHNSPRLNYYFDPDDQSFNGLLEVIPYQEEGPLVSDDLSMDDFFGYGITFNDWNETCLLYTSPSPRDQRGSRMAG